MLSINFLYLVLLSYTFNAGRSTITQTTTPSITSEQPRQLQSQKEGKIDTMTLSLKDSIQCADKDNSYRISQKGDFWVLYNYVVAGKKVHCYETITYSTHSDFTFMDNLEPLLERWQGPISLAMYAPGNDFTATLATIRFLRKCGSPLVAKYVTFHVYFDSGHIPKIIPKQEEIFDVGVNCTTSPPWVKVSHKSLYKTRMKLLYPINVGRNIARDTALTHYVLASDIELYPNPGIILNFMEMIRKQDPPLQHEKPKIFPLPLFEVKARMKPPVSKKELVTMLKNRTAIPFHKNVCPNCHNFPRSKEWVSIPQNSGLKVFHVGKRIGHFKHWEPIFIGTNSDPYYDERLSWEGKRDKMTQGYALCVLDYEFQILDNAFLVHKSGIKKQEKDKARDIVISKTNSLINKVILPELKIFYGVGKGCAV